MVLHTFFTDDTVRRAVDIVRTSADQAGRDPASIRIWSCYATIVDGFPEPIRLKKTVGRLAAYLQGYGDLMVATNDWDPAVLERFRADEVVAGLPGAADAKATPEQLEHIATLIPDEWLEPAATGSPEQCAARTAAVRPRCRRRHHARCQSGRAHAGGRGVPTDPTPRSVRCAPP